MLYEEVEKYLEENSIYRFEGDKGVEDLNQLCKTLGYEPDNFQYGSPLEKFLTDNSGAIDSIIGWIREQNVEEWVQNLRGG